MITIFLAIVLQTSEMTSNNGWKFSCLSSTFSESADNDYYSIGIIYYDYNKQPAVDPAIVPVLIDVKYSSQGNLTAYHFYFQGKSDQQLYYIINDNRDVVDKFLNTPSTVCATL